MRNCATVVGYIISTLKHSEHSVVVTLMTLGLERNRKRAIDRREDIKEKLQNIRALQSGACLSVK